MEQRLRKLSGVSEGAKGGGSGSILSQSPALRLGPSRAIPEADPVKMRIL